VSEKSKAREIALRRIAETGVYHPLLSQLLSDRRYKDLKDDGMFRGLEDLLVASTNIDGKLSNFGNPEMYFTTEINLMEALEVRALFGNLETAIRCALLRNTLLGLNYLNLTRAINGLTIKQLTRTVTITEVRREEK